MLAYFIGGSWDLTKRHMDYAPPVLEIVAMPRVSVLEPVSLDDIEPMVTAKLTREIYLRVRHEYGKAVAIYKLEGE